MAYSLLTLHLNHRIKQLSNIISRVLNIESHLPKAAKRYSELIIRLGEDDLAQLTYLNSRAEYLRRKVRAMQHPGALGADRLDGFLTDIAWLVVRVIKNSWAVYHDIFTEPHMVSKFFAWAKEQMEGQYLLSVFNSQSLRRHSSACCLGILRTRICTSRVGKVY